MRLFYQLSEGGIVRTYTSDSALCIATADQIQDQAARIDDIITSFGLEDFTANDFHMGEFLIQAALRLRIPADEIFRPSLLLKWRFIFCRPPRIMLSNQHMERFAYVALIDDIFLHIHRDTSHSVAWCLSQYPRLNRVSSAFKDDYANFNRTGSWQELRN